VPESQLEHAVAPVLSWYMPAAQLEQAPARAAAYLPAKQARQLLEEDAPVTGWNWPAAHARQDSDPVDAWYDPASQLVQPEEADAEAYAPAAQ